MDAAAIGNSIALQLATNRDRLRAAWESSAPVRHFTLDDLLPAGEALEIFRRMPGTDRLTKKKSLRESKWVGVDLERYDPIVGACLLAFQDPRVLKEIAAITGIDGMRGDPSLYASGVSLMEQHDFLNPHLDNSHDGDQREYRVLNLLYYVSPEWTLENGGNLELWTSKLDTPNVVLSKFNRMVVMETSAASWHSVQPVRADARRYCISNYYFAPHPARGAEYRNVTSFRGRPEQPLRRLLLWCDSFTLNLAGRLFPALLRRNPHRRR